MFETDIIIQPITAVESLQARFEYVEPSDDSIDSVVWSDLTDDH